jgi:hypothetical protein
MKTENKPSLLCNYDDELFKIFVDSKKNKIYLNEDASPEFVFLMDRIMTEEYEVIYLKTVEKCPFLWLFR